MRGVADGFVLFASQMCMQSRLLRNRSLTCHYISYWLSLNAICSDVGQSIAERYDALFVNLVQEDML